MLSFKATWALKLYHYDFPPFLQKKQLLILNIRAQLLKLNVSLTKSFVSDSFNLLPRIKS